MRLTHVLGTIRWIFKGPFTKLARVRLKPSVDVLVVDKLVFADETFLANTTDVGHFCLGGMFGQPMDPVFALLYS